VSDANAEVVREAFLASAGGDPTAGERFYDPSLEWDMSGVIGWPEKPVYRGREEVVPFMQAWADSWQDWHYEVEDVREAGSERVFLALHEWGIGVGSGASVDQRRYFVMTLRAGQIVRVQMFSERAEALKAAELGT
jgi:ketosteroid isomerase-like protein